MKRLTGILTLGLVAAGLTGCGSSEHAPAVTAQEPIPVRVVSLAAVDTAERLEAGGVVAAQESATVSSRIVATIAQVRVKAGDRVRAGDVLVTLDARDITEHSRQARAGAIAAEKSLTRARADQRVAEAEQRLAAAWHTRIAALHARNSATDHERDEAEARLTASEARLASAQSSIDVADASLASARAAEGAATATESFATVRAPFDGLITERLTDRGNLATPGLPLVRIESDGARQVVARVDEARATYIHPGDRVNIVIGTPDQGATTHGGLDGVVAEVAREVDVDQRAFTVKVTLPRAVTARTGTFARVIFEGAPRRALLAPAGAIRRHGQVATVFVVQDGVARLRLIQTGASSAERVEVLAGLDAGETIVTSPPPQLVDGMPVAVRSVATSAGGGS